MNARTPATIKPSAVRSSLRSSGPAYESLRMSGGRLPVNEISTSSPTPGSSNSCAAPSSLPSSSPSSPPSSAATSSSRAWRSSATPFPTPASAASPSPSPSAAASTSAAPSPRSLTALLIGFIGRRGLIKYDTAIGILFVAAFALGLAVISKEDNYTGDLFAFVFGNVLAVTWDDVYLTAAIGGAVLLFVAVFYKELLFTNYDPAMAAAAGLPVALFQYALLALVALTTVIAIQTIGVILVVALLITPAATAQLLVRSLPAIMLLGAAIGALSSLLGLYLAWHADLSASASIVLTATALFALAFVFAPHRGLLWQTVVLTGGRIRADFKPRRQARPEDNSCVEDVRE